MAKRGFNLAQKRDQMITAPVTRLLFDLSWPMTLGLFSVIAINVTDTFYIGRLGEAELAAIGFCFPVIFGMSAIAIGMGNGGAAIVSRAIGSGHDERIPTLVTSTLIFTALFAIVLAILTMQVTDSVFLILGAPRELLVLINEFMVIWYWGLPFLVLPIVLNGLIRATGEANVPSGLMVVAAVINAVISPFIIFGLMGFPALGITGAALSTVLARSVIFVLAMVWLWRAGLFSVSPALIHRFLPCIRDVLRYGAPAFFAQLVAPVGGAVVTRLLSAAGPEAVAGFAVGARLEALVLIPFFALQTGITPFIGQNVGALADHRLRLAEKDVWRFALLWGGFGGGLLWCFGGGLSGLFTQSPTIAALSDLYLEAIAFGLWGAGLLIVGMGIINPLGYPNLAMAANVLRYLILYAGLSAVGVIGLGWQATDAVFIAAALSFVVTGLIVGVVVHRLLGRPNRKDLVEAGSPAPAPSTQ